MRSQSPGESQDAKPAELSLGQDSPADQAGQSVKETLSILMTPAAQMERPSTPNLPAAFSQMSMVPAQSTSPNTTPPGRRHQRSRPSETSRHNAPRRGKASQASEAASRKGTSSPDARQHNTTSSLRVQDGTDSSSQMMPPGTAGREQGNSVKNDTVLLHGSAEASPQTTAAATLASPCSTAANAATLANRTNSRLASEIGPGVPDVQKTNGDSRGSRTRNLSPGNSTHGQHTATGQHNAARMGHHNTDDKQDPHTDGKVQAAGFGVPEPWRGLAAECSQAMDDFGMRAGWLEDVLLPWAESACGASHEGHRPGSLAAHNLPVMAS